jgi:hypothetical protein
LFERGENREVVAEHEESIQVRGRTVEEGWTVEEGSMLNA